ncbi:MAG: threonine ammonia-lyase [Acidimicrobiales bacterium]
MEPLALTEIQAAASIIESEAIRTPVVTDPALDRRLRAEVFCKVEAAQTAGSFKFRGAYHRLSKIPSGDRSRGVVAVSSGNHGAAVARAAELLGIGAVIFIPHDAPTAKRQLIESSGAEVVVFDRASEDREALAEERVRATGAIFVHPFEDRDVMLGQGTAALEFHRQVENLDLLLVPVSGGGLLAGCSAATNALAPRCTVVGVEPARGDDTRRSFEAGHPVSIEQPDTIADGLAVTSPGANTFALFRPLVDRIETVTEEQIAAAMVVVHQTLGLMIEPSGAVGIATLMVAADRNGEGRPANGQARRIGVVLSGGNIDADRFNQLTGLTGLTG